MFEEMAVLVDAQGEMLDAIEARWVRWVVSSAKLLAGFIIQK
jgi:hypothetical protein